MSTWRMRPTLQPNLQTDPASVLTAEKQFKLREETPPTLTEQIKFYCEQLVRLTEGKQGRKIMVLEQLRKYRLAPKAKSRK